MLLIHYDEGKGSTGLQNSTGHATSQFSAMFLQKYIYWSNMVIAVLKAIKLTTFWGCHQFIETGEADFDFLTTSSFTVV